VLLRSSSGRHLCSGVSASGEGFNYVPAMMKKQRTRKAAGTGTARRATEFEITRARPAYNALRCWAFLDASHGPL
jgi:hypothetical protein